MSIEEIAEKTIVEAYYSYLALRIKTLGMGCMNK